MSIGICYPDHYAVEETFQLLKVPWEWYEPGRQYDVVIARRTEVPDWTGNLIDLTVNDFFKKISDLLNTGQPHLHEPSCDILLDTLRQQLKKYTVLVEILPAPWGHPYMVALTHDVDVTSVRECRLVTVGYAAFQCITHGEVCAGIRLALARIGVGNDPWVLFGRWKTFEEQLGVRSTFFFVPKKDDPGMRAHPYRAVGYDIKEKMDLVHDLKTEGWETGVHGIDNWADEGCGKEERKAAVGPVDEHPGNRTHWLLFDKNSWKALDEAGYLYDTTFGYNDDAGFRAGTTQVYQPRGVKNLLELPLHIQDLGLFGKFCWAPADNGWKKTPCLHLDEHAARVCCDRIFDYARKYGGAVTLLWHYENLTPPRSWSGLYADLVKRAKADGAWVTTAGEVVGWFKARREIRITCTTASDMLTISTEGTLPVDLLPQLTLRLHNPDNRQITVNAESYSGKDYIDIKLNKKTITVLFS
jgi:hypothetical protein